jgi:prolyl-tRNA editing enzyme YbaK/EbsC (Cys-tRNA(Pro) deacylase)
MNMVEKLSESACRVQAFLLARGYDFAVSELPGSAGTAREAAESLGCSVSEIAKSLIFKDEQTGEPVLVIASGSNRVDVAKIEAATGLKLGRADGKYVKEKVGFAIGGIPPVAHSSSLRTILDPDLKRYKTIWAAAGTPHAVFRLNPADLEPLTSGEWLTLAE